MLETSCEPFMKFGFMSFLKVVIIFCFLFIMNNSLAQQKECAQVLKDLQTKSVVVEKDLSLILQEVYPNIVKPFLKNNQIDFGARNTLGRSILHVLAIMGYVEAVDLLLRLKEGIIPVHTQDEYGRTVLHYAVVKGDLKLLKILLSDSRIDVNVQDKKGWTVLHKATLMGQLEVVKFLVTNNLVDVNAKTFNGKTILHLSAFLGYFDIVDFLLKDGRIDVNVGDEYGVTALDASEFVKISPISVVETLQQLEGIKVNNDLTTMSLSSVEEFLHKNQKIIELLKATQVIH